MKAIIFAKDNNHETNSCLELLKSKDYDVELKIVGEVWQKQDSNESLTTPQFNNFPVTIIEQTYIVGLANLQKFLELKG